MSNTIYCTYLTTYSGDKLPPLYIGSTSVQKIEEGYHGSVKSKKYRSIWLSEIKENPHLFQTQILTTHETRKEAFEEEVRYQIEHDVVRSPEYINMAIANGTFSNQGHSHSEDTKKKMSKAHKGKKIGPLSEDHKRKLSQSTKGKSKKPFTLEHRLKLSKAKKGRTLSESHKKKIADSLIGRIITEEQKEKMSMAHKGKHMSPEAKKKMSNAKKGTIPWNKNKKYTIKKSND